MAKRGRPRKYPIPETTASTSLEEKEAMKITMVSCAAGPDGVARPGTVLDLPEAKAKELIDGRHARLYDREKDAKKPYGLQRAPENYDQK